MSSVENCSYSDLTNAMAVLRPEESSLSRIFPSPGSYTSSALSSEMVPGPRGGDAAVARKAKGSSITYSLCVVSYRFLQCPFLLQQDISLMKAGHSNALKW